MLSKVLVQDNLTILKYSLAIVSAYNTFKFVSRERFLKKKNKEQEKEQKTYLQKILQQIKEDASGQFLFLFLSLATINLVMRLGMSYNKEFKKYGFLVGFLSSYYFVRKFEINFPLSVSFYVLARIGVLYIQKAQKMGLISKRIPIMKLVFMMLISILNYYLFLYPQYLPKKMVQNYKKYGNLDNKTWLDMRSIAMKVTGDYDAEI